MIYLIDHEDSFTFNLAHLLGLFDEVYISNYYEINKSKLKKANTIVLSPGPGEPKNYPITKKIYKQNEGHKKTIPSTKNPKGPRRPYPYLQQPASPRSRI